MRPAHTVYKVHPPHAGWLVVAVLVLVGGMCFWWGNAVTGWAYDNGWEARGVYESALLATRLDSLQATADSSCVAWFRRH